MVGTLPPNRVRHLSADASLLRQHHSAAIPPQPPHRPFHQLRVSHADSVLVSIKSEDDEEGSTHHEALERSRAKRTAFFRPAKRRAASLGKAATSSRTVRVATGRRLQTRRAALAVGLAAVTTFIAFTTTGLLSTVSSKYLSAAMVCAVALPGVYPSASITRASFFASPAAFRTKPFVRRSRS